MPKPNPHKPKPQKRSAAENAANILFAPLLAIVLGVGVIAAARSALGHMQRTAEQSAADFPPETTTVTTTTTTETTTTTTTTAKYPGAASRTTKTVTVNDTEKLIARNAILLRCDPAGNEMLAERAADAPIYPASMTKIMTLITFFDLLPEADLDASITMDADIIRAQLDRSAYVSGFYGGEDVRIKDLLYALMLPSSADAAVQLAVFAAGSEEAFVARMNSLAHEMGLTGSHFMNTTGLHHDDHKSTVSDVARMLEYALRDPVCAEIMSAYRYTSAATASHPEGIRFSSTTLTRMVGDELEGLDPSLHIIGGKTGFTRPAGQCLATWAEDAQKNRYICVVAGSTMLEPLDAVGDTLTLYQLTTVPLSRLSRITVSEADLPDYEHY